MEEHNEHAADPSLAELSAKTKAGEAIGEFSLQRAIILNALIIAAAIITAALIFTHGSSGGSAASANSAAAGQAAATSVNIKDVATAGDPFIGNPNAPVTLAYWSDYQCPFCKQFETSVLPTVIQNYVATGKVKVVFKDFSFLGPDSDAAATFARAVWNLYPQQFFAWRTAMFNAQDEENQGFGDEASIEKLTAGIPGIDVSKVSQDIAKNGASYMKAITADRDEASGFGIQGTPSFITGTVLIPGVVAYQTLASDFDSQLK